MPVVGETFQRSKPRNSQSNYGVTISDDGLTISGRWQLASVGARRRRGEDGPGSGPEPEIYQQVAYSGDQDESQEDCNIILCSCVHICLAPRSVKMLTSFDNLNLKLFIVVVSPTISTTAVDLL